MPPGNYNYNEDFENELITNSVNICGDMDFVITCDGDVLFENVVSSDGNDQ